MRQDDQNDVTRILTDKISTLLEWYIRHCLPGISAIILSRKVPLLDFTNESLVLKKGVSFGSW